MVSIFEDIIIILVHPAGFVAVFLSLAYLEYLTFKGIMQEKKMAYPRHLKIREVVEDKPQKLMPVNSKLVPLYTI